MNSKSVVVIGAGISGVAAARELQRAGVTVTLVERNDRIGGRLETIDLDGVQVDMGAQFITNTYSRTHKFIRDLGIDHELVKLKHSVAILKDGKPVSLTSFSNLLGSGLLSLADKLRLARGFLPTIFNWPILCIQEIWKAAILDDRSVSVAYSDKRGMEVLSKLVQPILNGFFYWSPERSSEAILAVLYRAGIQIRTLYSLKNGLQSLAVSAAQGLNVYLAHEVIDVRQTDSGAFLVSCTSLDGEKVFHADGIVCATPATAVAKIFPEMPKDQAAFFSSVSYSATVAASYLLDRRVISPAFGVAYPAAEVSDIAMATVTSKSARNDLPEGKDILSFFASGKVGADLCKLDDDDVSARLSAAALAAGAEFDSSQSLIARGIVRWPEALPEFDVGHLKRLKDFHSGKFESGALVFAGDYIGGPFIEGALSSGIDAASRLFAVL